MDENSMLYWFPKLQEIQGVEYPETKMIETDWGYDYAQFIDERDIPSLVIQRVREATEEIGYPVFIRTDHMSGKHNLQEWPPLVESENELEHSLSLLLDESFTAGILGLPIYAIAVRDYIELDSRFKAFGGMPVARERRYFVDDGEVVCHHPYWPEKAMRFWHTAGVEPSDGWREQLHELNRETNDEIDILMELARLVASHFGGYWSVDFAHTSDDRWILIDMALGNESWHPEDCPNAGGQP